jgi:hypothetical protein
MLANFNFGSSDSGNFVSDSPSDNFDTGENNGSDNDIDLENSTPEEIAAHFEIPLENVIVDEETGKIIRILDADGEVISDDFFYDQNGGQNPDTSQGQQNQQQAAGAGAGTQGSSAADPNGQQGQEPGTFNLAIETAQRFGLDLDHITYTNEQGQEEKIPFSELTPEMQLEVTNMMVQEYVASIQNKPAFQNKTEEGFINSLRSGKTPRELALEILQNDGEHLASSLSDFDLYVRQQKNLGVELTEAEFKEAFEAIPASTREKQINAYREQLKKTSSVDNVLNAYEQSQKEAIETEYKTETEQFQQTFAQLEKESRIGNFQVSKEYINDVKAFVLSPGPGQDSEFIKALSTPEGVIEAAFWYKNINQYQQNITAAINERDQKIKILENKLKIQEKAAPATTPNKADTWKPTQQDTLPQDAIIV